MATAKKTTAKKTPAKKTAAKKAAPKKETAPKRVPRKAVASTTSAKAMIEVQSAKRAKKAAARGSSWT